jgi:hypothetical protein
MNRSAHAPSRRYLDIANIGMPKPANAAGGAPNAASRFADGGLTLTCDTAPPSQSADVGSEEATVFPDRLLLSAFHVVLSLMSAIDLGGALRLDSTRDRA